jgi:hypothetical protein
MGYSLAVASYQAISHKQTRHGPFFENIFFEKFDKSLPFFEKFEKNSKKIRKKITLQINEF